jgi:hypothetical protein
VIVRRASRQYASPFITWWAEAAYIPTRSGAQSASRNREGGRAPGTAAFFTCRSLGIIYAPILAASTVPQGIGTRKVGVSAAAGVAAPPSHPWHCNLKAETARLCELV